MVNNVDPMQIGRIQAIVPDVSGLIPTSWAMPCLPVAGINTRRLHGAADRLGRLDRVRAGRPGPPDLGRRLLGHAGRACPSLAQAVPPAVNGFTIQTTLKNGIVVSDVPGPTGGILIQTTTGAMISVSDVGIVISNGKGAIINMVGPSVDVNVGALTVV